MHRGAHYLLNIRPSGDWPAQYFYYAGGVPRVMEKIKDMLHLDVMTVTGKTLGENLEAAAGGPIALVEEEDLIYINVKERKLEIVGVKGEKRTPEEMEEILKIRKAKWQPKPPKYTKGTLKLFSEHAVSPIKGGYMV